jgi:hypothetical protein
MFNDPHQRLPNRFWNIRFEEYIPGKVFVDVVNNPPSRGPEEESHHEEFRIVNVVYVPGSPKCLSANAKQLHCHSLDPTVTPS